MSFKIKELKKKPPSLRLPNKEKSKRLNNDPKTPIPTTLDELIQCGLCFDTIVQPKMLPCQHTFCFQCLSGLAARKNSICIENEDEENKIINDSDSYKCVICCPICKTIVKLENGVDSLSSLPNNIYVESLLAYVKNSGDASPTRSPGKFARSCSACRVALQLEDLSCDHCKQPLCKNCWEDHSNSLIAKLPNFNKQLDDASKKIDCKMDVLSHQYENMESLIHDAADFKILDIKSREEEALDQLRSFSNEIEQNAAIVKQKIAKIQADIAATDLQNVQSDEEKVSLYLKYKKQLAKVLDTTCKFGELKTVFDRETLQLNIVNEPIQVEVEDVIEEESLNNEESIMNFYKKHKFTPKFVWSKCPRPSGIGVPPWRSHHLYIATNENKIVVVFDRKTNKVIGRLTHDDMLCPNSLAFSESRKETFVVDKWKHCIHVFSSSGDYLRTLCSRGTSEGKLISPEGIAVENNKIYVCDTGNNRIVVLNAETGQQLLMMGRSKQKTDLALATGVAYFNSKLFVVDCGSNRVKVFDLNGEKAFEFGSTGKNRGEFQSPENICVDPLGNILVGDCGNGRIQVFTPSGEYVKSLGKPGTEPGSFKWISGLLLHITEEGKKEIIVADHKNNTLQIF